MALDVLFARLDGFGHISRNVIGGKSGPLDLKILGEEGMGIAHGR